MMIDGPRPTAYTMRLDDISVGEVFFADPAETIHGEGPYLVVDQVAGSDLMLCTSLATCKQFAFRPDLPVAWVGAKLVIV